MTTTIDATQGNRQTYGQTDVRTHGQQQAGEAKEEEEEEEEKEEEEKPWAQILPQFLWGAAAAASIAAVAVIQEEKSTAKVDDHVKTRQDVGRR